MAVGGGCAWIGADVPRALDASANVQAEAVAAAEDGAAAAAGARVAATVGAGARALAETGAMNAKQRDKDVKGGETGTQVTILQTRKVVPVLASGMRVAAVAGPTVTAAGGGGAAVAAALAIVTAILRSINFCSAVSLKVTPGFSSYTMIKAAF